MASFITIEEASKFGYVADGVTRALSCTNGTSNYLVCPSLCPNCDNLRVKGNTSPFECYGSSSAAAKSVDWQHPRTFNSCGQFKAK